MAFSGVLSCLFLTHYLILNFMESYIDHIRVHWFDNSNWRIVFAFVLIATTIFAKWLVTKLFKKYIIASTFEMRNDATNYKFLSHAISAIIYVIGFSAAIYAVPPLRSLANSMLAGAGILAVAIGFASQQAFSNIVSGLFIVMFKPFRVNDRLQIRDVANGTVEDVTLRHTVIRNFENRMVIVPNSVISQEVLVNSHIIDEKIHQIMELGVGYSSNIDKVREIVQEEVLTHPDFLDNREEEEKKGSEPKVKVEVISWGDFSMNLRIWFWVKDSSTAYSMRCNLYESLKKRFDEAGIEIPYPYRNVVNHLPKT